MGSLVLILRRGLDLVHPMMDSPSLPRPTDRSGGGPLGAESGRPPVHGRSPRVRRLGRLRDVFAQMVAKISNADFHCSSRCGYIVLNIVAMSCAIRARRNGKWWSRGSRGVAQKCPCPGLIRIVAVQKLAPAVRNVEVGGSSPLTSTCCGPVRTGVPQARASHGPGRFPSGTRK